MPCNYQRRRIFHTAVPALVLLLALSIQGALAASVSVAWDPSADPDVVGYRTSYGSSSGLYSQKVDVGNTTSTTIQNLSPGATYYITTTAYDSNGVESLPSNEIVYTAFSSPPASVSASITSSSTVSVNWTASPGAATYNVKRSTTSGGNYVTQATGLTATTYADSGLASGTTYYYVVSAVNSAGESQNSSESSVTLGGPLPSPWTQTDVGTVAAAGIGTYANGTYCVEGSGAKIASKADEFHYVWQFATGDCSIVSRVATVENTDPAAKAGIMVRESQSTDSRYAGVLVTPTNGLIFQRRSTTGGNTVSTALSGMQAPCWIKLTRTGTAFKAYYSANGLTWTQLGKNATISMTANVSIGLAVGSRVDGTLCTSTFGSVTAAP